MSSWDGVRMDVVNPAKMQTIQSAESFLPAVNIPGYEIGVIDTVMDISWPGSDYSGNIMTFFALVHNLIAARYDGIIQTSTSTMLARWSSCCGKPV